MNRLYLANLAFGVLFVALKLTHQIDWSWVWVLTPFWLPYALIVFGLGVERIARLLETPGERAARLLQDFATRHYRKR